MPGELFRFKEFELDRSAFELRRAGQSVHLERIPLELLCLLVERNSRLVTGEEIIASIWGKAVTEFQNILDHRGIVGNEIIGALAHLGMGLAYALQGESAKARTAYQDFFTLWKDADPDIPVLLAAKAEYAKLHSH